MIISIHQPNYFPWIGYFSKIKKSDVFVFLDNVDFQQGNKNSITSRTKIKNNNGELWITIPVKRNGTNRAINSIIIDDSQPWRKKHLKSIQNLYSKCDFYSDIYPVVESLINSQFSNLAEFNRNIILEICALLNIKTDVKISSELGTIESDKNKRIIEICKKTGSDTYLCGKGGLKYIDNDLFSENSINIATTNYNVPEYSQKFPPFIPGLSILDVLLNCGVKQTQAFLMPEE